MALISASAQALSVSAGPYEISGALYAVVSLSSRIAVFKSTDGGATWNEQDSAGAPPGGHVWYDVAKRSDTDDLYVVHVAETASSPFQADLPVSIFNTGTDSWDLTTPSGPSIDYTSVDPAIIVDRGIGVKIYARTNGDIVVAHMDYWGSGADIGLYFDVFDGASWNSIRAGGEGHRRIAAGFLTGTGETVAFHYQHLDLINFLAPAGASKLERIAESYITGPSSFIPNNPVAGNQAVADSIPRNLGSYQTNTAREEASSCHVAFAFSDAIGAEDIDGASRILPAQSFMSPLNSGFDRVNSWMLPYSEHEVDADDAPLTGIPALRSLKASGAVFVIWKSGADVYRSYRCTNVSYGMFKDIEQFELERGVAVCPCTEILASGAWGSVYQAAAGGVYYEETPAPTINCPTPALIVGGSGNVAWFA